MNSIEKLINTIKAVDQDDLIYILLDFVYDDDKKQGIHYLAELIDITGNIDVCNDNGITVLMFASAFGLINIVQQLITLDANVNQQTKNGYTALMFAAEFGYDEIVQSLIRANANIFLMHDGEAALMKAVKESHYSIVKLLIEHGMKKSRQEKFHVLRVSRGPAESIYALLDDELQLKRALIYALDSQYIYNESVNREIINLLMNSEINLKGYRNQNFVNIILHLAIRKNDKEIIHELVKQQVDLNGKYYGLTPLIFAIKENKLEIAELLINSGADITLRAKWFTTALSIAYQNNYRDATQLVLKAYEKVKITNCVDKFILFILRNFDN